MAEKPDPDDQEIRRLLAGSREEINEAISWISELYEGPLCGSMRRDFRWFPAENLADAWQSTLLTTLEKALVGQLDTTAPILPFLWIVLRRRCCDVLNQDARCTRALKSLSQNLASEVPPEGSRREEAAELFHLVDRAILHLPHVQRLIWEAYRERGYSATDEELLEDLSKAALPRQWTLTSVRRGKQEGRKKLRRILRKRGYLWPIPTNPSSHTT